VIVVDASVWASAYLEGDLNHDASLEFLMNSNASSEAIYCPATVLAEVAGAIARRTGSEADGVAALTKLDSTPYLTILAVDPDLAQHAGRLAAQVRLRGMDAFYVAVALRQAAVLVTWDAQQLERGSVVVETRTPAALLTS
jgi:predicted nucleic acid-binding protein